MAAGGGQCARRGQDEAAGCLPPAEGQRLVHGRQIAFLTYKLAAEGIALERQREAYSSKTCCSCDAQHKPKGRTLTEFKRDWVQAQGRYLSQCYLTDFGEQVNVSCSLRSRQVAL
jgi:hypothetical protein